MRAAAGGGGDEMLNPLLPYGTLEQPMVHQMAYQQQQQMFELQKQQQQQPMPGGGQQHFRPTAYNCWESVSEFTVQ
jgi:hypothetical protein